MMNRSNRKNSGRSGKFTLVCAGVCLLIFQTFGGSAQTVIYTYGGGISPDNSSPPTFTDDGAGNQTLTFDGVQSSSGMFGVNVLSATSPDPTLTVNESIDNTSSFVWTEYILGVSMNQTFTINSAGVTAPSGWTAAITPPSGPVGGIYTGTIDYYMVAGGTPVAIYPAPNSTLYYGFQLTFNNSTYSVTESATPVPEPGSFSFLLVGGLLLGGRMFAKRRQAKVRARA